MQHRPVRSACVNRVVHVHQRAFSCWRSGRATMCSWPITRAYSAVPPNRAGSSRLTASGPAMPTVADAVISGFQRFGRADELSIECDEVCAERTGEPQIAGVVRAEPCLASQHGHFRRIDIVPGNP